MLVSNCIQRGPAVLTRSSVHLVGGSPTLCLPVRGRSVCIKLGSFTVPFFKLPELPQACVYSSLFALCQRGKYGPSPLILRGGLHPSTGRDYRTGMMMIIILALRKYEARYVVYVDCSLILNLAGSFSCVSVSST